VTARPAREYRRLPGSKWTPLGSVTLWAGEDHLLLVELRGFTEIYRRFYFRDVQAIVLRGVERTGERVLFGIFALILLLLAVATGRPWTIFWGSLSALLFLALVVDLARGPGCACTLRTALQTVELRSLRRLRTARRVIDRLRPLIELEQGALAAGDLAARIEGGAGQARAGTADRTPVAPPVVPQPPVLAPERPLRHDNGRVHEALAYVLLVSAVAVVVPLLYFNILLNAALSIVFLARVGLTIAALARQNHSDLPRPLMSFAWSALVCEGVIFALGTIAGIVIVFTMLERGTFEPGSQAALNPLAIVDLLRHHPAYRMSALLCGLIWLTLGTRGLLLQRRFPRTGGTPWQTLPT
jgi:hypothetical protein